MISNLSMQIDFKVGPIRMVHTLSSEADDILMKKGDGSSICKYFLHYIWSIHGRGLSHRFQC